MPSSTPTTAAEFWYHSHRRQIKSAFALSMSAAAFLKKISLKFLSVFIKWTVPEIRIRRALAWDCILPKPLWVCTADKSRREVTRGRTVNSCSGYRQNNDRIWEKLWNKINNITPIRHSNLRQIVCNRQERQIRFRLPAEWHRQGKCPLSGRRRGNRNRLTGNIMYSRLTGMHRIIRRKRKKCR